MTANEVKDIIYQELPHLMVQDGALRDFVLKAARDECPTRAESDSRFNQILDELRRDREANNGKWAENNRKWDENQKALEARWAADDGKWAENQKTLKERWAADDKRWAENQKVLTHMIEAWDKKFDSTIGALGARWGLSAEAAFRQGLKSILEDSFPVKVEQFIGWDSRGIVWEEPDQVELDLIVHNGTLILCEIKSSATKSDVATFHRKARWYEAEHQRKPDRLIFISPMLHERGKIYAAKHGIETASFTPEL